MEQHPPISNSPASAPGQQPLPYAAPGVQAKSQWITDGHPGAGFLVGCLMVLGVLGVVVGGIAAVLFFLLGWW
jgi:hypothetical protein